MPTQDFSMYKTLIGDDKREMVEIPEGPFTMGVNDGDPDEGPAHPSVSSNVLYRHKRSDSSGL